MRPGVDSAILVPGENGSSSTRAPRSDRFVICSSVCGRRRWRPRTGRSGPRPGRLRCGSSWTATAVTSPAPAGWAFPGSRPRCGARSLKRGGQKPCLRIVREPLLRAGRSDRGHSSPTRRVGTSAAAARGLVRDPTQARRHRDPDDRSARRTRPDRTGYQHPRAFTGRRRSDPRRDRRPEPLRHRQGAGQARRPGAAGEEVRQPSPARRSSPAKDDRSSGWRPGARSGAALQTNTVYAARYRHLTARETNKLTATQAQSVIAAAILRHLHAVITTGTAWDPVIATHGTRRKETITIAA